MTAALVVTCAILAVGLVIAWDRGESPPRMIGTATAPSGPEPIDDGAPRPTVAVRADDASTRTSLTTAADAGTVAGIELPYEFELTFVLTAADDLRIPHARVLLAPAEHDLNDVGETGPSGTLTVRWRARCATLDVVYRAARHDLLRRRTLRAGVATTLGVRLTGTRTTAYGIGSSDRALSRPYVVPEIETSGYPLARVDADGWTWFRSVTLGPTAAANGVDGAIVWFQGAEGSTRHEISLSGSHLRARPRRRATTTRTQSAPQPAADANGVISGRVLDQDGAPLHGVPIYASRSPNVDVGQRTTTGRDGAFSLDRLEAGTWFVRAGGSESFGLATTEIELDAANPQATWTAALHSGTVIGGRLVAPHGGTLPNWRLQFTSTTHPEWVDATRSDSDGRFVVRNAAPGPYDVEIVPSGWPDARPAARIPAVWLDPADDVVVAEPYAAWSVVRARTAITGSVGDSQEQTSAAMASVRLWRVDDPFGFTAEATVREPLTFDAIPPGSYRVVAGGGSFGWRRMGTLHVESGAVVEPPVWGLTAPGWIRFEGATESGDAELAVVVARDDIVSEAYRGVVPDRAVPVPVGGYGRDGERVAVSWRYGGRDGAVAVASGETRVVSLD